MGRKIDTVLEYVRKSTKTEGLRRINGTTTLGYRTNQFLSRGGSIQHASVDSVERKNC